MHSSRQTPDTTGSENTQAVQFAVCSITERLAGVRSAWMGSIRSTPAGQMPKRGDLSSFRLCRANVSRPTIIKIETVASSASAQACAEDAPEVPFFTP